MQVTELQIERSLAALRSAPTRAGDSGPRPTPTATGADLCAAVVAAVQQAPALRADVVEQARLRLHGGSCPSADDLARHLVGRLVCDRLR